MKHPDLLEGLTPLDIARRPMPNFGGRIGVGFAGGGGSSIGLKQAGLSIDFAMNHDASAIAMHAANCPEALHFCQDIWQVRPEEPYPEEPIRFMWFSPDCKHFSKAKGGAPVEKKIRDLAWVIVLWAKIRRPDVIAIENVEEFRTWGPLIIVDGKTVPDPKRKGEYFRRFNAEMRRLGYIGDWMELRACNFGTPTFRKRLFGQFRCDGQPIVWPEPTHGAPDDPDVVAGRKLPWKTAADSVIDWTEDCHSIFLTRQEALSVGVNRPLVDATLARITLGLQRFVLESERPFIVPITHSGAPRVHSVDDPTRTVTCANRGELALAVPSMIQRGWGEREGQAPRALDAHAPVGTQVSGGAKHAVVASYVSRYHGAGAGGEVRGHALGEPMLTDTAGGNRSALVAAHLTKFRQGSEGVPVDQPAPTMTSNSFIKRPGGAAPVGIVAAHMIQNNGGAIGHSVEGPVSTVCTKIGHHALSASYLTHLRGSGERFGHHIDGQVPTLTATRGSHIAETRAFIVKYFSSAEHGQPVDEPMHTVTTKPRFALIEVNTAELGLTEEQRYTAWWVARLIDVFGHPAGLPARRRRPAKNRGSLVYRTLLEGIERLHSPRPSAVGREGVIVWDIGMRMLTVAERYRAQGVGPEFITDVELNGKPITATKLGEMCGNMVCPQMSEAIARAALPELQDKMEIAS